MHRPALRTCHDRPERPSAAAAAARIRRVPSAAGATSLSRFSTTRSLLFCFTFFFSIFSFRRYRSPRLLCVRANTPCPSSLGENVASKRARVNQTRIKRKIYVYIYNVNHFETRPLEAAGGRWRARRTGPRGPDHCLEPLTGRFVVVSVMKNENMIFEPISVCTSVVLVSTASKNITTKMEK